MPKDPKANGKKGRRSGRQVLKDHVQRGKKFTPPLMEVVRQSGGDARIEWVRWGLPELVWMALLLEDHGPQRGCALIIELLRASRAAAGEPQGRTFMLASDFASMDDHQRQALLPALVAPPLSGLRQTLARLTKFYPAFPMGWLAGESAVDGAPGDMEALDDLGRVVGRYMSRRDRRAMVLQTAAVVGAAASGALKLHHLDDPNLIIQYPDTDESRRLAASVRAMMNFALHQTTNSSWSKEFWRHGRQTTRCIFPRLEEPEIASFETLAAANMAGTAFARAAFDEIRSLYERVQPDLDCPARSEVLFGLLQRQAQIAADLARLPPMWVSPWGEMANRAMAEALIRLKWFATRDKPEHYEWFIDYGLGQEKLHIEHLSRLLEEGHSQADAIREDRQSRGEWLDEQRYSFLQEVDVGGGTHDLDLRKMAEEAGCPDLRSLVFQPLSSAVHGPGTQSVGRTCTDA